MGSSLVDQGIAFNRALRSLGTSGFYSDEMCGRLLAYAALSGSEDVVLHLPLHAAIRIAQDTFEIEGGNIPDMEKLEHVFKAMRELRSAKERVPEWWPAFAERYGIAPKLWPMRYTAFRDNAEYYEAALGRLEMPHPLTHEGTLAKPLTPRVRKLVKFVKVLKTVTNLREGDVQSIPVNLRGDDVIEVSTVNLRE